MIIYVSLGVGLGGADGGRGHHQSQIYTPYRRGVDHAVGRTGIVGGERIYI